MRSARKAKAEPNACRRRTGQRSKRQPFYRVMRELEAVSTNAPEIDPFVEQLRKCPDTFVAGEMLARMFDAVKYDDTQNEDERLLPPVGAVLPLV